MEPETAAQPAAHHRDRQPAPLPLGDELGVERRQEEARPAKREEVLGDQRLVRERLPRDVRHRARPPVPMEAPRQDASAVI